MATMGVVEFQIGSSLYALDIHLAREIVEMMPITPLPRAPSYLEGIMNLRGEITNIVNLSEMLGLSGQGAGESQKIIVLAPEASGGSNVGIVVDDVHSVIQVTEGDVERMDEGISREAYLKGIIKLQGSDGLDKERKAEKDLIIWIDIQKILEDLLRRRDA
jgi:purine-binding chemotaxis protein CheW